MIEDRTAMMSAYARSLGLKNSIPSSGNVPIVIALDLNEIIDSIRSQIPDIANQIYLTQVHWGRTNNALQSSYMNASILLSKVNQLISYLELVHHMNSTIIQIGSLFNSIKDQDLKSRCSDLLSAPGNFDRAINQATQVLEDKIRKKSGIDKNLTGPNLVNAAINSSPEKGLLRISDSSEEHEGIAHICRGLMLAFRNPTHHGLSDNYTREDALKVCAFIDNMILAVERSDIIPK